MVDRHPILLNSILGGMVFRYQIGGWDVSWESSGKYRHWCLQSRPGHTERVVVVMKNPGSLSGDGSNLSRDTTLRILRVVGDAVQIDWLVVNLFDFATPRLQELHDNWQRRDAGSLVFGRLDIRTCRFVVFAHGDFNADFITEYAERVAIVRTAFKRLREIPIPTTKAGNPVHPMNWQRNGLMPEVIAGIGASVRGALESSFSRE